VGAWSLFLPLSQKESYMSPVNLFLFIIILMLALVVVSNFPKHEYRYGINEKDWPVEVVYDPMLPTRGPNDDGAGWKRLPGRYERKVYVGYPPDSIRDNMQEHAPGVWHKKG
jgi:hypothetical protein